MVDFFEGTRRGRRRDAGLAGAVLLIALFFFFLPSAYQQPVRRAVRMTALRPFLAVQAEVSDARNRRVDVSELQAERDSLAALVAAQASLAEDNRQLRALLGLKARAGPTFVPADVVRPGIAGGESTFMLEVGRADGVEVGSMVVAAGGLLGVVWEVDEHTSYAIDWTHADFRASAMTADGQAYGIVEPRRGEFREEDMMALIGAPFHSDIRPGTRVVTSGRGGIYPRGIPLGVVVGIEEADTGWRKTYLLRPAVRPASVTHVIVGVRRPAGRGGDLSELWHVGAPPDTAAEPAAADTEASGRSP